MPDSDLRHWQNLIYEQIKLGGKSLTLKILANASADHQKLRALMNSPDYMRRNVWRHSTRSFLNDKPTRMLMLEKR